MLARNKVELDLSHNQCHFCGYPLQRDYQREKEWCTYRRCFLFAHEFNIPYKIEDKYEVKAPGELVKE